MLVYQRITPPLIFMKSPSIAINNPNKYFFPLTFPYLLPKN
jgi:hypothetical protein